MNGILALPEKWMFSNYYKAFNNFWVQVEDGNSVKTVLLGQMFLNSVLYAGGTALMSTLTPCIIAYLAAKYKFKFSRIVYVTVILVMTIPIVGNMPSMLETMRTLGLYDTYIGMLLQKLNFANMYFIIFYGTFRSLAGDYAEAAKIDGASHSRIMFSIMFPLVGTTLGVVFLLNFIAYWNDYLTPMVYWPSRPTAALGMFLYSKNSHVNSVPDQLAGCMLLIFPIFVLFLIFQKHLMGNIAIGGLKG